MEKKKENEIRFKPADYAHLNKKLPFQEWISEILSRNEGFRADHEKLLQLNDHKEIKKHKDALYEKYKVHVPALPALSRKIRISFPPTVSVGRITNRQDLSPEEINSVECTPEEIISGKISVTPCLYPDTLLLTINLNRPREEIDREVQKAIHSYKKRKAGNLRLDKWKYHLIAFDLDEAGYTQNEIGEALQGAYARDDDRDCFSPETIKKYVREGKNLVDNLGYLKYL